LLFYFNSSIQLSFVEIVRTFIYGFRLDIAIAGYTVLLPSLTLTLGSFKKSKFLNYFFHTYTFIALLVIVTVITGDLFMYRFWGFRIDATPLFYMTNIKAMTASVSPLTVFAGLLAILTVTGVLFYIYLKLFSPRLNSLEKENKAFIVLFPSTLFLFVVVRGGIGISSLTTSSAYFSKNQFANHAAINPIWNAGFSLTESIDLSRKYVYYSDAEVQQFLTSLKPEKMPTPILLNTNRPNIILIITESLTAKVIEATGGKPGIMPELNRLVREGVLFNQVYAASDRTDKGIAAVLAGYPSLPGSSPLKYQKITEKIAFLPGKLNDVRYKSEFYYGGTLEFANYKSFLVQAGYDKMVSDKDFHPKYLTSKWGAFDHLVFNRCLADTPENDTMFFKTILTLTSHEPFEIPVKPAFAGDDDETKFMNSLHYTDQCFGNFIREAKKMKWWDNTLVIIIADHGSKMPGNSDIFNKDKYHIPMIWLGGALNVQDTVIENLASQTDLASTLLSQLDINSDEFKFSNNILNPDRIPYAFFTFNNGFGFLKPGNLMIYDAITNSYSCGDPGQDSINWKQGKAYLQSIFNDFKSKNK
jgi:phosphoglycerol transferase MdoB-like AlkP superfamily enzyme